MTQSNTPKKKTVAKKTTAPKKATAKKTSPSLAPAKRGRPPKKKAEEVVEQINNAVDSAQDVVTEIVEEKIDQAFALIDDFAEYVVSPENIKKANWVQRFFRSLAKRS
jgi:adenylate kinase family enzyme